MMREKAREREREREPSGRRLGCFPGVETTNGEALTTTDINMGQQIWTEILVQLMHNSTYELEGTSLQAMSEKEAGPHMLLNKFVPMHSIERKVKLRFELLTSH